MSCYCSRYDKRRYPYRERPVERRWAVTTVAKFSFYCTAMILFCVLMYIPVYNRANEQIPKGWTSITCYLRGHLHINSYKASEN